MDRASRMRLLLVAGHDVRLDRITVNDAVEVDGELVRMDSDSILVSATKVVDRSGFEHTGDGETVHVGRDEVYRVEARRVSVMRSLLAAGGVLALGTATGVAVDQGTFGSGGSRSGSGQSK
jgi:hypothetical protein